MKCKLLFRKIKNGEIGLHNFNLAVFQNLIKSKLFLIVISKNKSSIVNLVVLIVYRGVF